MNRRTRVFPKSFYVLEFGLLPDYSASDDNIFVAFLFADGRCRSEEEVPLSALNLMFWALPQLFVFYRSSCEPLCQVCRLLVI